MTPSARSSRRVALAISVLALASLGAPAAPVTAATDRLPDVKPAPIRDLRIVDSGGRRLLRFTGTFWNQGAGPFETRAGRPNTSTPWDVDQIVYDTDGGFRRIETDAVMRYAGDGHDHWHVRQVLTYHLWGNTGTFHDTKIGFCFFDTNLIDGDLPRSPSQPVYRESMCGKKGSLNTRNGVSVGWGDKYPWNFAFQWIDISGLPGGTYTLRVAFDLYHHFSQVTRANDCAWATVRFGASGSSVTVVSRGTTCINDHSTSPFAADVAWAGEAGISSGCDADMFCTYNPMTRGLVAKYLARAMHLPAATKDYFTDDDTSVHEAFINSVAAAGITTGCGGGRFCPTRLANRGETATFLAKALRLPATSTDFFDDDDGSPFESAINRLAKAGIASGCGERRYCPDRTITRGQMVALLRRAFDPSSH